MDFLILNNQSVIIQNKKNCFTLSIKSTEKKIYIFTPEKH